MKVLGPNELLQNVIQKDLCIGCGACISLCPYFRSYKGKTAMMFPCTLEKGRCFAYCPKIEVDLDEISQAIFGREYEANPLGSHRSVKIAKAGTKVEKGAFQAGGAVSALMKFAFQKKYIDAAVLTDKEGILPVPKVVKSAKDVVKMASSKYTASPTLSAFNQAVKDGYKKIGIVGTPCQTLSIAQMRMNPMSEAGFSDPTGLVIGLFCTWALDFRSFDGFVSKKMDVTKIRKVDIPPPPAEVMEIYLDNKKKIKIPLDEIRKLVPETCSYCIDMTSEFADISVGVLEGKPNMNTLIIRTERGQKIVDEAVKAGFLIVKDIPKENLDHLLIAAGNKKKRAFAKTKLSGLLNSNDKSSLRVDTKTADKIIG
jgi:coenzyme F420 hydrogenase subunit beta